MRSYLVLVVILFLSCKKELPDPYVWKEINVKSTAYNSIIYQTNSKPFIAAWGDTLKPGERAIAVSKDLLKLGLTRNTPIKIKGFDSIYYVKDRMHSRKRNQIDIYMGTDIRKAKKWGVKKLTIEYGILKSELPKDSIP